MNLKSLLILFGVLLSYCGVYAEINSADSANTTKPLRIYTTTRLTTAKPTIDGVLKDSCWQTGEWSGEYTQWIPKEGARPSEKTQMKILYDDKNLYVALRAFDKEPSKISRKAGRRDEMSGDVMGVTFDSYHDHRTGFEFSVTAAGQKVDLILTNPWDADPNWNAVWYVKTGLEDSAWVAEYQIPLSQLRYSKDPNQVWGVHAWRWIDRLSEESDWEPQSLTGPGMLYAFGELRGINNIPKSQRIEIMPYAVGKLKTFAKVPENPFARNGRSWMGNIGLDAKIGLSSNFTADLTVNPDFGQVESDPSVMNLTAFETFYEEKRPFFLEGKNIFKFDLGAASIFYSRRIGQAPEYRPELGSDEFLKYPDNTSILSAVKISGKSAGGLAIGVLHSLSAGENARLYSGGSTKDLRVEPLTSYTVGRIQQDFKEGNTVLGAIFTSTNRFINDPYLNFLNRNALSGGIDFLHQWNEKEFFVDAKIIGSSINGDAQAIAIMQRSSAHYYQRPDAGHTAYDPSLTQLSGQGGVIKIGKGSKGLLRYSTEINWKSPGLDLNDMGFMQMADVVANETMVSYLANKPVSIFRTYSVSLRQNNQWDYRMNYQNSGIYFQSSMEFLNKWAISPAVDYLSQSLDTHLLRGGNAVLLPAIWEGSVNIHSDLSKKIYSSIFTSKSATSNDHYRNSYYGVQATIIPYNVLKFSLSLNYSQNEDNLQYVDTKLLNGQNNYLMAHISQKTLGATFRIDYNITPEISLQYYGSPFASVGKYSAFKEITQPRASRYADRFSLLSTTLVENEYQVEANGDRPSYSIQNPDFTFTQFRSNLVFRWEYLPGSQVFVVWGNERTSSKNESNSKVSTAMGKLIDAVPNNIFLIKLNYWFSL